MTSATDSPVGPQDLPAEPPEATAGAADRSGQAAAKAAETEHRQQPRSEAFKRFVASGWGPRADGVPAPSPAAPFARERRERLSGQFPGERLVIPAGVLRVRSNDTDHRFRPHSAFAHLTGLGTDQEPDAVLVLEPRGGEGADGGGHDALLYFRPRAGRDVEEFYADPRYGELWVGRAAVAGGDRGADGASRRATSTRSGTRSPRMPARAASWCGSCAGPTRASTG